MRALDKAPTIEELARTFWSTPSGSAFSFRPEGGQTCISRTKTLLFRAEVAIQSTRWRGCTLGWTGEMDQSSPAIVFPVEFTPRLDDHKYNMQALARGHQQPSSPKSLHGGDDEDEAPPSRHLWVGNVSQEVTEGLLMENFSKFGPIESLTVYSQRNYAFINFRNLDSAQNAKNGLQGVALGGLAMRIEFAKGAKPSRHLWVGGIGLTVSREQVEGEFKRFGTLEDFKFLRDRNCAFVDYEKMEDAIAAVHSLNRMRIGDEELRVDFGRSQPPKRENLGRPGTATLLEELGGLHTRNGRDLSDRLRAPANLYKASQDELRQPDRASLADSFRGPSDVFQAGAGPGASGPSSVRTRGEKEEPSDVLWVGFPLLSKVDEEGLRRAFVLYGEVQRVKTFPGRTYAFVQFRSIQEATRAKNALEGKLFNDPRVHIRFSNSEIGPVDSSRTDGIVNSPTRGRETPRYSEKLIARAASNERFSTIVSPLRPAGLRPEYYPGGLGRGATAKVIGTALGNRGLGGGDERTPLDQVSVLGGRGLPGPDARPRGSSYDEQWELPEEEIMNREPKRLRILHVGCPDPVYDSSFEGGQGHAITLISSGPGAGLASLANSSNIREGVANPAVGLGLNDGWRWHGTIAKGGTPVCRAQCLPVGKGIDVTIPDVVNCTARTDLDMLAKHVYQAGDFGVVFFVPEADPDVPPYRDFMHYLGEKHRAGVAKLADGTTLFLVPPSEFSERVLKVPGNNCLFGVVLKPQSLSSVGQPQMQQQQPQSRVPPPQQHNLQQQWLQQQPRQILAHQQQHPHSQNPALLKGISVPDIGVIPGPSPPQGQVSAVTSMSSTLNPSQLANLAGGLPAGLTPELIESLTALLPQQNQLSLLPSAPQPLPGTNMILPASREGIGKGAPSLVSVMPSSSLIDSRIAYRPSQINQHAAAQSKGWTSLVPDQQSNGEGQSSSYVPSPLPHLPQMHHTSVLQLPLSGSTPVQVQRMYPGTQAQDLSGSGYGGQQLHTRHPRHPVSQMGGTSLLPSDQLAQLTALLTQKPQQPVQQQHEAQLLYQHYHQLTPVHPSSQQHQPQPPSSYHQPQVQSHHQQMHPPQQYTPQSIGQQQWPQGGSLFQQVSHLPAHSQFPSAESSGSWDGPMVAHVQNQQSKNQPQTPSPTLQQSQISISQQPLPSGIASGEQTGSMDQDDAERQKRFQATLQLAAALLQQMQHQQTPGQGTADQR